MINPDSHLGKSNTKIESKEIPHEINGGTRSQVEDMVKKKEATVQIRVTDERKEKWVKWAENENKSITQFVIDTVEQYQEQKNILNLISERLDEFREFLKTLEK